MISILGYMNIIFYLLLLKYSDIHDKIDELYHNYLYTYFTIIVI